MLEIAFCLVSLLVTVFISIRIKKISPISFEAVFYVFYIVYAVFGSLVLLLKFDERRLNDVIIDDGILYFIWFSSILTIVFISLFVVFLKSRFLISPREIYIGTANKYSEGFIIAISIFFVSISFLQFYISDAPLSILLSGGEVQDAFMARQSKQVNTGFFKLYHFNFITKEAQFFWGAFLFAFFLKERRLGWVLILITISLLVTFYSNLSKAGGIFLLAAYGLIFLTFKNKKLSLPIVSFGIVVVVLLAVIPQYLFVPSGQEFDFSRLAKAVLSRIVSGQIEPAYYIINHINSTDYLYGQTFPNPKGVLPFTHFDLETKTWELMNPTRLNMGLTYRNPTVFWVDGYANFSYFGIVIYAVIVALLIFIVDRHFLRYQYLSCLDVGLLCYLSFHYARLSGKSLSTFFWDLDLIVVIIFYIFFRKNIFKKAY